MPNYSSNIDSIYLTDPMEYSGPTDKFVKYECPSTWRNLCVTTDIFHKNNEIFISNNYEQINQLVNVWNTYVESTNDYIDWE